MEAFDCTVAGSYTARSFASSSVCQRQRPSEVAVGFLDSGGNMAAVCSNVTDIITARLWKLLDVSRSELPLVNASGRIGSLCV